MLNKHYKRVWAGIGRYWGVPFGLLGALAFCLFMLPPLVPLVVFALGIRLLGESLAAFFVSACAAAYSVVLFQTMLPGCAHYLNGGIPIEGLQDVFLPPFSSDLFLGLIILNVFFTMWTESLYFKQVVLPGIRRIGRTARLRLFFGMLLGCISSADDAACGGVLNRFFKDDITSPGVKWVIKEKMLALLLLLANCMPAVASYSAWFYYYKKSGLYPEIEWSHAVSFMSLPLTLIFLCLLICGSQTNKDQQTTASSDRARVGNPLGAVCIPCDFLRSPAPKGYLCVRFWVICVLTTLPLIWMLVSLILTQSLVSAFAQAIIVHLFVTTCLDFFIVWREPDSFPAQPSPFHLEAASAIQEAEQKLVAEKDLLVNGAAGRDMALLCGDPKARIAHLDKAIKMTCEASRSIDEDDIPEAWVRDHNLMREKAPTLHRLGGLWKTRFEALIEKGVKDMGLSLIRVYLIMVVSAAMQMCLGVSPTREYALRQPLAPKQVVADSPLDMGSQRNCNLADDDADGNRLRDLRKASIQAMLCDLSGRYDRASSLLENIKFLSNVGPATSKIRNLGFLQSIEIKMLLLAVGIISLLWLLRTLRLSSAWGVLAIVFPLVDVMLTTSVGADESRRVLMNAFFGLTLSYGIWCNSTLPSGDNVTIAAAVLGMKSEDLARRSRLLYKWPLRLSTVLMVIFILLHSQFIQHRPIMVCLQVAGIIGAAVVSFRFLFVNKDQPRNEI